MRITRIEASNFKSFDAVDIEFRPLNILIGANAAGKSNLISIISFFRNIASHSLQDAISMEGGIEYVRNTSIGTSDNMRLAISYESPVRQIHRVSKSLSVGIKSYTGRYEFSLGFVQSSRAYKIVSDNLSLSFQIVRLENTKEGKNTETEHLGDATILASIHKGKCHYEKNIPNTVPDDILDFMPSFVKNDLPVPKKTLLIYSPYFRFFHWFHNPFDEISLYDFDPRLSKKAASITGKTDLEENGSNLSIVLKRILDNPSQKRKFLNLFSDSLPFISDLHVMKFADRSYLFTIRERYKQKASSLPGSFVSDGTIHVAAIITALYFTRNDVISIEEPERNIHPQLLSRLLQMCVEVSPKKQVFLTTHNPEVVRHADPSDLILVSRSPEGFSRLSRPADLDRIKSFLEADMGMEELFVQNFLGLA